MRTGFIPNRNGLSYAGSTAAFIVEKCLMHTTRHYHNRIVYQVSETLGKSVKTLGTYISHLLHSENNAPGR